MSTLPAAGPSRPRGGRNSRQSFANAPLGLVSTYAYVNPVVAITLGVIFRGESLTWRLLIGAAIVVVAVATVVRREPPAATIPDEGFVRLQT